MRAVLFDFDGLLLDTEYPDFLSWHEMFAAHGCVLALETWAVHTGSGAEAIPYSPYEALEHALGCAIDQDAIRAARRRRFAELMEAETLLPGVVERLQEAGKLGLTVAIVSSSPREWIEGYLARFGLTGAFDAILSADDVTYTKPHPELYLAALSRLEIGAHEAVVFEDFANGIASAREAGIYCIAVPNALTRFTDLSHAALDGGSLEQVSLREHLAKMAVRPAS